MKIKMVQSLMWAQFKEIEILQQPKEDRNFIVKKTLSIKNWILNLEIYVRRRNFIQIDAALKHLNLEQI